MVSSKRSHRGTAAMDSDSDEEFQVDVSVAATPAILNVTHQGFTSKRTKTAHEKGNSVKPAVDLISAASLKSSDLATEPVEDPHIVKKRKQGASVMMSVFSKEFLPLQDSILLKSYHPDMGTLCACGTQSAAFRCGGSGLEYCFDGHLRCQTCIVNGHTHGSLPFHRIEKWTGTHFIPAPLHSIGYILYLGHQGRRCPNLGKNGRTRTLVIGHMNGYHQLPVQFCECYHASSEAIQLSNSQLFPATMEHPQTAFTFSVLDYFHQLTMSSKTAMYDFVDVMVKLTDPAFPQDVPVRYQEMGRIFRVWAHLSTVRRRGQAHGIDDMISARRKASLVIRCPACPEIDVNVGKETIEHAKEDEAHKYTLFLSADGNFRLQRKNKKDDPDDVALNDGRGYFVETAKYNEYLKDVKEDKTESGVCSHIRAFRLQNFIKFKNAVVSGVVAVICARHGFYLPQGMVDLRKGEAFANTDYALAHSLDDATDQRWIMLSYDIWCSYSVNIKKRFAKTFPKAAALINNNLRGAIPKMHIKNHIDACQLLWAFNYLEYSGETCGEIVETGWSEQNQAAGSTKEMNDGHRHDILDEYHGKWNFTKLIKMSSSLYKAYTACLDALKTKEIKFAELVARTSPPHLEKWYEMNDKPRMEGKEVMSVHVATYKQGPPTQAKAYKALLLSELEKKLASSGAIGSSHFINNGLRLERDQLKIRSMLSTKNPSASQAEAISKMRKHFSQELVNWRQHQFTLCPLLKPYIDSFDPSKPEDQQLFLPSAFDKPTRQRLHLEQLATVEYQLREGQAYDALDDLREKIKIFNANLDFKKNSVFGHGPNTRAQAFLSDLANDKVGAADKYRIAREALIRLGLSLSNQSLQELRNDQLYGKDTSRAAKLGDSKKEDPWFWTVGRPGGTSSEEQEEWSIELDRVQFFRERSARNRRREEKEILESEIKRTTRTFVVTRDAWFELGKRELTVRCSACTPSHSSTASESKSVCLHSIARSAYAYKQASMYDRFASDSEKFEKSADEKRQKYEDWFTSFSKK